VCQCRLWWWYKICKALCGHHHHHPLHPSHVRDALKACSMHSGRYIGVAAPNMQDALMLPPSLPQCRLNQASQRWVGVKPSAGLFGAHTSIFSGVPSWQLRAQWTPAAALTTRASSSA
jgi:hypothetical protein